MAEKKKQKSAGMKRPDNFDELEKEFEEVLNELLTDESLERFRKEYEKLHEALLTSHESERKLMSKVRELNEEITGNAEKIATAVRLSKEDEATIANLTQEMEKAWKLVEYLQDKETWSRETINTLRQEIDQLKELVERSANLAVQVMDEEDKGQSTGLLGTGSPSALLAQMKSSVGLVQAQEKAGKKSPSEETAKVIANLKEEESRLKSDVYQGQLDLRTRTLELQKERTKRAKTLAELSDTQELLETRFAEIKELERQLNIVKERMNQQEVANRSLQISNERFLKEMETVTVNMQMYQSESDRLLGVVENMQMENNSLHQEVAQKANKLSQLTDVTKKLNKSNSTMERKVKTLTEQRSALRKEKEHMLEQLVQKEKAIEASAKQREVDQQSIVNLMRERDVFNKNLIKQVHATEKQSNLVSLGEQANRNLSQEIIGFHREADKQRRIILQMERERDRYITENGELTLKVMKGIEECQIRDLRILDYNKKLDEMDSRLKIQKNMFEAVHQDKNLYSQRLVETQDEMGETKKRLLITENQTTQLKEEVANREAAVVKEHMEVIRLEKERDSLLFEIQMFKQQLREYEKIMKDLKTEEKNLLETIAASDEIIKRQKRELDKIISERDILGSQLVRRNDEVSLLYQKTKLLQILIENGNRMYDQRIEDIRLLRVEVKRQRYQNQCLQKKSENMSSYKQELYSIHRDILHERARRAALETELSHPRQIHRWRGLEITDPSKFELLQKVQALQKRLISRTEEVVEVERVVQEKDRLYLELRNVLERQPGPEVTEKISTYQRVLREKNKQLKSVLAELNMLKTDTEINKNDIERLELKYVDMKQKYFKEKKLRHNFQDVKTLTKQGLPSIIPGRNQFTGGGFNVTQNIKSQ